MSLNEIMTCVRENIPAIGVVFNNGQWGAEKKNQVYFITNTHNSHFKTKIETKIGRKYKYYHIPIFWLISMKIVILEQT